MHSSPKDGVVDRLFSLESGRVKKSSFLPLSILTTVDVLSLLNSFFELEGLKSYLLRLEDFSLRSDRAVVIELDLLRDLLEPLDWSERLGGMALSSISSSQAVPPT